MMLKIVPSECVDVCGPVCIFMQGHRSSSGWDGHGCCTFGASVSCSYMLELIVLKSM